MTFSRSQTDNFQRQKSLITRTSSRSTENFPLAPINPRYDQIKRAAAAAATANRARLPATTHAHTMSLRSGAISPVSRAAPKFGARNRSSAARGANNRELIIGLSGWWARAYTGRRRVIQVKFNTKRISQSRARSDERRAYIFARARGGGNERRAMAHFWGITHRAFVCIIYRAQIPIFISPLSLSLPRADTPRREFVVLLTPVPRATLMSIFSLTEEKCITDASADVHASGGMSRARSFMEI